MRLIFLIFLLHLMELGFVVFHLELVHHFWRDFVVTIVNLSFQRLVGSTLTLGLTITLDLLLDLAITTLDLSWLFTLQVVSRYTGLLLGDLCAPFRRLGGVLPMR